jgi:molecular chaperone HscB
MDGAFLMQQIELREELAELKDKSEPLSAIADFVSRMEAATANLTTKLSGQLAANELESARETVRQMQFYKKLREEALLIEEGLLF